MNRILAKGSQEVCTVRLKANRIGSEFVRIGCAYGTLQCIGALAEHGTFVHIGALARNLSRW